MFYLVALSPNHPATSAQDFGHVEVHRSLLNGKRAMGTVHQLLSEKSKQEVIAAGVVDRDIIEVAAKYMTDEESGLGFVYSGWCMTALPHSRIPGNEAWRLENGNLVLLVEPGRPSVLP